MCLRQYESPEVAIALGPLISSETEGPGAGGGATWLAQLARLVEHESRIAGNQAISSAIIITLTFEPYCSYANHET